MDCLVLVDGEHYPPVIKQALKNVSEKLNYNIVGGVFLGGTEKISKKKDLESLNIPLIIEENTIEAVSKGISKFKPDLVLDLSDEPVVGYKERFEIANCVINKGIQYKGSDFCFYPPVYLDILQKPSVMIAGTGKRIGKTAVSAYTTRFLSGQEENSKITFNPCVVTMGRGGPGYPEVIEGHKIKMDSDYFLNEVSLGKHAASDHYEDALMSRVRTIGCRRCGGGFSGKPFYSVVKEGAELANKTDNDFLIFEGSGATNPPVKTDTCIMIVGAHQPLEYIAGFMGPLRIMMADFIILTMCEEPMADSLKIKNIERAIKNISSNISVVKTVFRPKPLKDIKDKRIILCTTAPEKIGFKLKNYLQEQYNCNVLGISHYLSNRSKLIEQLDSFIKKTNPDVLLTEVKAASMDIVTKIGAEKKLEVVYVDNIPVVTEGNQNKLNEALENIADLTVKRFQERQHNG